MNEVGETESLVLLLSSTIARMPERVRRPLLEGRMTVAEAEYALTPVTAGKRRRRCYSHSQIERCMEKRHGKIWRSLTRRMPQLAPAVACDDLAALLRSMPYEIFTSFGGGELTLCEARYAMLRNMNEQRLQRFVLAVNYEARVSWLRHYKERIAIRKASHEVQDRLRTAYQLEDAGIPKGIVEEFLTSGTPPEHQQIYREARLRANTAPELQAIRTTSSNTG